MDALPFSYATLANVGLIENLHAAYIQDPKSVDPSWRQFFEGVEFGSTFQQKGASSESSDVRIDHLIAAYRTFGHLAAHVNPLEEKGADVPELELARFGFSKTDLDQSFPTCGYLPISTAPLKTLLAALQKSYCRTIGIEYFGTGAMQEWLKKQIEPSFDYALLREEKLQLLDLLIRAELLESFLHVKYVGQKRFSLEGGETLIPILTAILDTGVEEGVKEAVIGMAHRGRLNVLSNVLGKPYATLFAEFEDHEPSEFAEGTGDVKYHKGFIKEGRNKEGEMHITLSPNPSHLEAVDPVVEGISRAHQEKREASAVLPILLHGDAALAGQGVVYETMQLGKLGGYKTGGTIHIVINNQIGFTTLPKESRSTLYCTDLARTFGAPVFHVNAEDPEGCFVIAKLCARMRQRFGCDLFIDLNCYRKYGHNEGDEPSFTQPLFYQTIRNKKSIREIYREKLLQEKILDTEGANLREEQFKEELMHAFIQAKTPPVVTEKRRDREAVQVVQTAVEASLLQSLSRKMCQVPENFSLHPKVAKLLEERLKMVGADSKIPTIDWGMGEHLAYATLLLEGKDVRISGQDVCRGTFSHRHAALIDQKNEESYSPLSHLKEGQGQFAIYNSPLSEFAVLGFEFGYSLVSPNALVIWEAQYGDFSNGAQVIIDQFLTTSEQKWASPSSLVVQLPHGYEGQGPEHSSARLERFLQLAGNENIQIVNCTTSAQLFHLLRRQLHQQRRTPLIIFTPKKLLRDPQALSPLDAFTQGEFSEVLDDPSGVQSPERLLFCSGKVYYDLVQERASRKQEGIAIIRIEQLYPLNERKIAQLCARYHGYKSCYWIQEESRNMGAWEYIAPLLTNIVKQEMHYAGRERSAATAVGSHAQHLKQYKAFMDKAYESRN